MKKILLLLIIICLSQTIKNGDTFENISKDLQKQSDENLKKIIIAIDSFLKENESSTLIKKGARNFVDQLSTEQKNKFIENNLRNVKFDDKAYESLKDYAQVYQASNFNSYEEYLKNLSKEDLIKMALKAEEYSREKTGNSDLIGGLHDYIYALDETDIRKIILNFTSKYPELQQKDLLYKLSTKQLLTDLEIQTKLNNMEQPDLVNLAITLEVYQRKKNNIHLLGGLHDYAHNLPKDRLIEIIMKFVENNPELKEKDKLENLSAIEKNLSAPILGGIEDYLRNFLKPELISLALAGQTYEREKNNQGFLLGGLEDYVHRLPKNSVLKIVSDYIDSYPELRRPGTYEKLAGINEYGIVSILQRASIDVLKRYALASEDYESKKNNGVLLDGSVKEKIDALTKENLIAYCSSVIERYPELVKEGNFEKMVSLFNGSS